MGFSKISLSRLFFYCAVLGCSVVLYGCSKSRIIEIPSPSTSDWAYLIEYPRVNLGIIDSRRDADKALTTGVIDNQITIDEQSFEPFRYLKKSVAAELKARGFEPEVFSQAPLKLYVDKFNIHTEREGPYAPFVVWIGLQARLDHEGKNHPINALVVKQHYPKFTYGELDKPLYGDSLEQIVKEVSAKIALHIRDGAAVGNLTIQKSSEELNYARPDLHTVYELGYSNNQQAVPTLVELLHNKRSDTRIAAIYGLGILQAKAFLPTLTAMYDDSDNYLEKINLLKAILDMRQPRARTWVEKQLQNMKNPESDDPLGLLQRTVDLYQSDKAK